MVVFLAIRCFSCQAFQVNQKTKSGKWKCRLCGEGQSIVKVWGRGDHAKDVRGLVMELNAVAGRGDDPSIVLRNYAGGLGSQSLSLSHRPQARDNRNPSGGMPDRDDDGFDFSMNDRFAVPRHLQQQQQQHTGGAEGLRSVEPANLTRSEGFMPAGLAPGRDSSPGEGRSAEYLENSRAGPTGYGGYNVRGGIGFETHAEHSAAAVAHAPTWRPSVEPPGIGSRGGSRWGVFASDEAALVLKKRQGPDQQIEGDPNFVTSMEAGPPRRRASPNPERRGRKRNPPTNSSSVGRRGHPPEESGMSQPLRWGLGQDQAEEESTSSIAASADDVDGFEGGNTPSWRHHKKARRREWSPSSYAPRAGQADPLMTAALRGGGREQRERESFGMNRGGNGSDTGGGGVWEEEDRVAPVSQGSAGMLAQRGMFPRESYGSSSSSSTFDGGGGHGGVGGTGSSSSSSSRWSKFLR